MADDEGTISLDLPGGSLAQPTDITITRLDDSELPNGGIPKSAFELGPDGLQFEKPVSLTITFDAADLPAQDASWLRVVQLLGDGALGPTELVSVDEAKGSVTVKLYHLSKYALADMQVADATIKNDKKKVTDIDVLFLVDSSGSMEQEQENLAKNFPVLIDALQKVNLGFRVGVASADLGAGNYGLPSCEAEGGDGGKLMKATSAGCPIPTDPWIESTGGTTNVPGDDVTNAFSCMATLGTGGCGFEQTLESVRLALDPAVNPNFIRADAALAVVFITDEDDCSAHDQSLFDPAQQGLADPLGPLTSFRCTEFGISCTPAISREPGVHTDCKPMAPADGGYLHPISRYVDAIKQLKPEGNVIVSAIAGPTDKVEVGKDGSNPTLRPSCQTATGFAVPPIRIASFVSAFGGRGSMHSICESDFSPALKNLGQLIVDKTQLSWCLPFDPTDTVPSTPELDGDCAVVGNKAGKLPACKKDPSGPCYQLSRGACGGSNSSMDVLNITPEALGDEVYAICLTL